jgi:hypothetical protein
MRGAILPLLQFAFVVWCSVKSTGTTLPFYLLISTSPSQTSRGVITITFVVKETSLPDSEESNHISVRFTFVVEEVTVLKI